MRIVLDTKITGSRANFVAILSVVRLATSEFIRELVLVGPLG